MQEKITNWENDYTKHMYNVITLANTFRLFWNSMRNGDRVAQEHVMIDFLGIFYLLKK